MPTIGMKGLRFDHTQAPSLCRMSRHTSPTRLSSLPIPSPLSITDLKIDQIIDAAESLISKWNPETATHSKFTLLFLERKSEAMNFINCVNQLQKAMHFLAFQNPSSEKLVHAQNLMQLAMKRLQKEFYQILSMNRSHLDPGSVSSRSSTSHTLSRSTSENLYDDDDSTESFSEGEQVSSSVVSDLKAIAECMILSGYSKECVSIYKIIRKSIIDEGIYRLRVEKFTSSQVNKMEWESLDVKIQNWLEAVKIAVTSLFNGERILCDEAFALSDSIGESCFAEISNEGATILFEFPKLVAKSKHSPPEKIFRLLDMYTAISSHKTEIEMIFSFDWTSDVRSLVLAALVRLGESVRTILTDFENSIQKYHSNSKSLPKEGRVHTLTVQAMNYLSLLADYSNALAEILADCPRPAKSSLPELYLGSPSSDETEVPAISVRLAWIILILLCKLDGKAKHYKDVAVSYLFLANNLEYVVGKVRASNLQYLLGEGWITKHEEKAKQFAAKYEKIEKCLVSSSVPENPKRCSRRFGDILLEKFNGNVE